MIELTVNGRVREAAATTVVALIEELGHDPTRRGVAVAVNGAVVPRSRWGGTRLASGDEVEIVSAVQGG